MFSKNKIIEPTQKKLSEGDKSTPQSSGASKLEHKGSSESKPKSPPSTLSSDLTITGNLKTTGDIQVEGKVEGDIRAHLLTVGAVSYTHLTLPTKA